MKKYMLGLDLLKCNFKSILIFEIIYKFVAALLFTPLLFVVVDFSLEFAGIKYLSNDNLSYFFTSSSTIIIICMFILCLTIYSLFEIMVLLNCFEASYYNKKISMIYAFRLGVFSFRKLFKGKNFLIILLTLLILPAMNIIQLYVYFSNTKFPSIVASYITRNSLKLTICIFFMIVVSLIFIKLIYSICYFCTENCNFEESVKKGLCLVNKRYINTVLGLLLWNIVMALVAVFVLVVGVFLIFMLLKFIGVSETINIITLQGYKWILILLMCLYMLFSMPVTFAYISSCFYKYKVENSEMVDIYRKPEAAFKNPKTIKITFKILIAILIINNVFIFIFEPNLLSPNIQLLQQTSVTAHRGDSMNAPENTIAAFESAIKHFADWIELDLKQTKDGIIVVMHDSNLKRTAGINKNVWEVTYEEIKNLDVGSWFSEEYKGEKIPTLDEVIKHVKGKIKLNIELKPTGHEKNFEKNVITIIKENNFEDECVITSLKYDTIAKVKEIDPEIKTIFVTSVAYGEIADLSCADGFSIEQNFVTKKLVKSIKNRQKDLYVWTVNNQKSIEKMLELGVDNIVTDNPLKAKEVIYTKYAPDRLVELIQDAMFSK